MDVRLLGTGGADGIPGLYSSNHVSRHARAHGGKNVRTRSAALVDGHIKIDLPPDTICQLQRDGLDANDWSALVFTHSHEDHFAVSEIQYALYPFTDLEHLPFSIYGNGKIGEAIEHRYPDWPIHFVQLCKFDQADHAEYTITPIPAHHDEAEDCFNLLFHRNGKKLLYATDTGIWSEETFGYMKGLALNCLVIECTQGLMASDYKGHLNVEDLAFVLQRLRDSKAIVPNTKIVTTHHAHTGGASHRQLEEVLAPLGAEPGYDGQVVCF